MTPNTSAEDELRCTKIPFFTKGELEESSNPFKKKRFARGEEHYPHVPPAGTEGGFSPNVPQSPRCPACPGSSWPHGGGDAGHTAWNGARGTSTERQGSLSVSLHPAPPPSPARAPVCKGRRAERPPCGQRGHSPGVHQPRRADQDTRGSSRHVWLPHLSSGCAVSGGGNSGKQQPPTPTPAPPGVLAKL